MLMELGEAMVRLSEGINIIEDINKIETILLCLLKCKNIGVSKSIFSLLNSL